MTHYEKVLLARPPSVCVRAHEREGGSLLHTHAVDLEISLSPIVFIKVTVIGKMHMKIYSSSSSSSSFMYFIIIVYFTC